MSHGKQTDHFENLPEVFSPGDDEQRLRLDIARHFFHRKFLIGCRFD